MFRSERMIHSLSNEEKHFSEKKKIQRSSSNPVTSIGRRNHGNETERVSERSKVKERLFYDGATQGDVEKASPSRISEATITENPETRNSVSRETHTRKIGLGETTNTSIMSHKLRKKGVCDTTDNSHYQRQFLRVLNKRF